MPDDQATRPAIQLSKHFTTAEFECPCGCGFGSSPSDIDPELVADLETIRFVIQRPIVINSGCRCPAHNAAVKGVKNSAHLRGKAADIAIVGGGLRRKVVNVAVELEIPGIGVAKTFVHLDRDETLPRPAVWSY